MKKPSAPPDSETGVARNPFSARYVTPGAIPYFFEPAFIEQIKIKDPSLYVRAFAESFHQKTELSTWVGCRYLADLFAKSGYRGQIVGPHGSGKSTLTASLGALLEHTGFTVLSYALHDNTRILPEPFLNLFSAAAPSENSPLIVILDGYEQLSAASRMKLRRLVRARNAGLLVTTHRRQWFAGPVLYRTAPSEQILRKIVNYLLDDAKVLPGDKLLRTLSAKYHKDFRSILFELYDWWEK